MDNKEVNKVAIIGMCNALGINLDNILGSSFTAGMSKYKRRGNYKNGGIQDRLKLADTKEELLTLIEELSTYKNVSNKTLRKCKEIITTKSEEFSLETYTNQLEEKSIETKENW